MKIMIVCPTCQRSLMVEPTQIKVQCLNCSCMFRIDGKTERTEER